jgi:hypothetical protein
MGNKIPYSGGITLRTEVFYRRCGQIGLLMAAYPVSVPVVIS